MHIATVKNPTKLMVFLGIILLFSMVSLIAANAAFMSTDQIYQGVMIGDISVGGLSVQEAQDKVNAAFNERIKQPPIVIEYQKQKWSISAQDFDMSLSQDAASLAQQAYQIGRTGSFVNCLQERYITINHGKIIPMNISYNKDKLLLILAKIAQPIDQEARDASLLQRGLTISISPEVIGNKVDIEATLAEVDAKLDNHIPLLLPLVVKQIQPAILSQDLYDIDGLIAIYTTQFDPTNANRSQNIWLAAKSLNAILLKPGEVASFNHIVGPRLAKNGYKEAPVFIDGKLVPDWGGGVCQVSSTLYNAVLLADMGIEERTSHCRPPGYVPLGQDATVADNLLDFKFRNTLSANVYISSDVSGNKLTVYIFGKTGDAADINIVAADKKILEPNTIVKQDPNLDLGKEVVEVEGQKGFQVTTYRVKSVNGQEISRSLLATDEFIPEDRVVVVGTKVKANQGIK